MNPRLTSTALLAYYASSLAVVLSAVLAGPYWQKSKLQEDVGPMQRLASGDGDHFREIVERGYSYQRGRASNVAFWPLYPALSAAVVWLTGTDGLSALLSVAHLLLVAAFVLLAHYVDGRAPPTSEPLPGGFGSRAAGWALACFALAPFGFFFRMAYSESALLATMLLAFVGFQRRWNLWLLALIVGTAVAARPVGVALVPAFAWHAWPRLGGRHWRAVQLGALVLLATWGGLAFAAYQSWKFGDPLATVHTQEVWLAREPFTAGQKLLALLTLEPIWSVYVPGSIAAWNRWEQLPPPLNCQFLNPLFFVGTAALIAYGAHRRWLTAEELLLSAGLLAIPYLTRSYEMNMNSHARFAAVVFPAYIVGGQILARWPRWANVLVLAVSGGLMCTYAALFAAERGFY